MLRWKFWNVAKEPAPAPEVTEEVPEVVGLWREVFRCHCGSTSPVQAEFDRYACPDLCGSCGCRGSHRRVVVRDVWQEHRVRLPNGRTHTFNTKLREEVWAPECCAHAKENDHD